MIAFLVALLTLAGSAQAQIEIPQKLDKPLFFEIQKNGQKAYVLGTSHIDIKLEQFPQYVNDQLNAASTVAVETDLDVAQPGIAAVVSQPSPVSLKGQLSADEWNKLVTELAPTGVTEDQLDHMYAAEASQRYLQVFMPKIGALRGSIFETLPFLDGYIATHALHNNQALEFLEPAQVQIDLIATMQTDTTFLKQVLGFEVTQEVKKYLMDQVAQAQVDGQNLMSGYFAGDYNLVFQSTVNQLAPSLKAPLLDNRNTSWIPVINALIMKDGTEFIAFGAAHLGGPTGVIELLKADGFTVTPVQQ
jgi:uncharacterized protein YbaP (TraB family)